MSRAYKHLAVPVDESNPWATDILDRKKFATFLDPVFQSISQPFVLGILSPYGTGKSRFVSSWVPHLRDKGFTVVKINAWESDFAEDPMIAFISAFEQQLQAQATKNEKMKTSLGKLKSAVGGLLTKELIPVLAQAGVAKIIGSDAAQELIELGDGEQAALSEGLGKIAAMALKHHRNAEDSVAKFRHRLEELVASLDVKNNDPSFKKLIVVVDELDRCRPPYAIKLLERLKHLFSVQGVVFVLTLDRAYLTATVKSEYGESIDTDGYLRRFLDLQIALPQPSAEIFAEYLADRFALGEVNVFTLDRNYWNGLPRLIEGFSAIAELFALTLRKQEQCFTQIDLLARTHPKNRSILALPLGALIALRIVAPAEYRQALTGDAIEPLLQLIRRRLTETGLSVGWTHNDYILMIHSWFIDSDRESVLDRSMKEWMGAINNLTLGAMKASDVPLQKELQAKADEAKTILQFLREERRPSSFSGKSVAGAVEANLATIGALITDDL